MGICSPNGDMDADFSQHWKFVMIWIQSFYSPILEQKPVLNMVWNFHLSQKLKSHFS